MDGDETRYLIDANRQYAQVLEEYDATTGTEVAYVYGNELIAQTRGTEHDFYLYDGHSGVRQLTDETGGVTDTYLYDAYGNVLKQVGDTENSYLYRGEQTDSETGLQYLRARYNDFETGRLISVDPFEGMTDVPMSRHRYLYGYGNPLKYVDPSGKTSIALEQALAFTLLDLIGALGTGLVAQTFIALTGERDIEWKGSLTVQALPDSIPLIPFSLSEIGLGNLTVGFITAEAQTFGGYKNTWLIVGVSNGASYGEASGFAGFPPVPGADAIVTSPSYIGEGPLTLAGGFSLAGVTSTGVSSGVFTIGFGKGTYAKIIPNGTLVGGGSVVGFSIPTPRIPLPRRNTPNLPDAG